VIIIRARGQTIYIDRSFQGEDDQISFQRHPDLDYERDTPQVGSEPDDLPPLKPPIDEPGHPGWISYYGP